MTTEEDKPKEVSIETQLEMADGCLDMIREELVALGCLHDKSHGDATPAMMYPEWIRCVVRSERRKAKIETREECAKSVEEACRHDPDTEACVWCLMAKSLREGK